MYYLHSTQTGQAKKLRSLPSMLVSFQVGELVEIQAAWPLHTSSHTPGPMHHFYLTIPELWPFIINWKVMLDDLREVHVVMQPLVLKLHVLAPVLPQCQKH